MNIIQKEDSMEKNKENSRRKFFLKGLGAAAVLMAAPGTGLFIKSANAQQGQLKRRSVREEAGVKEDEDVKPLARDMWKASVESAYDSYNAAAEAFVKGKDRSLNMGNALGRAGLRASSPEAKAALKTHPVPASILKLREQQIKRQGWHSHASVSAFGLYVHWHISW